VRIRVPDRLLVALIHAGAAPETLQQWYGVSAEALTALQGCPVEPLVPEDIEDLPEDGYVYELWKGELIRMSPGKIRHAFDAGRLVIKLGAYLDAHPLGQLGIAEPGFRIGPSRSVIAPDLAFVRNERLDLFPLDEYGPFAPDLAVEVISPGNTGVNIRSKVAAYLAHGSRLVWVMSARQVRVRVHRSDGPTSVLGANDGLSGEDLLPGFLVRVRDLFT
jgi:Uma2 family endonuclease